MPPTNQALIRAFYADCNSDHDQYFIPYVRASACVGLCSSFWEMTGNGLYPVLLAILSASGAKVSESQVPRGLNKWIFKKSHNRAHVAGTIKHPQWLCLGQRISRATCSYRKDRSRHHEIIFLLFTLELH